MHEGRPAYYVVAECGGQAYKSKVSKGKDSRAWWNEKFRFEFPMSHWRKSTYLKMRIMDLEFFRRGGFVGDTIIYLGGVITEGLDTGSIEVGPSPYNVVLEDDSYKGQIVIGFKFTIQEEVHVQERKQDVAEYGSESSSFWTSMVKLWKWKISWWKLLPQLGHKSSSKDKNN
ncbi:hypothetical protein CDL15_Pgr018815 [Punica granatum]|uniref:C2 domain-containing protein n=1 Tax=Punica granatum TaxID=22663 RepID=A0A218VV94_PUNGR|nr:hypothetical protein CDL15_Pgr018815 [Punica granatum]PKI39991.1 hypothetical protein CRG98_039654 [Punica granatum]